MRGEWIEISIVAGKRKQPESLPMRGEWIEISSPWRPTGAKQSLPMRGEWIEMGVGVRAAQRAAVSPHAGRVD